MDFPHLTDNAFPHLSTAEPYRNNPTFDYSRYDGMTAQAMLCNATWDEHYRHAVNWTVATRDAWFAALQDKVICELGFTRLEMERVSVDVPLDTARLYNYVVLRFPPLTMDAPIRHETSDGVRVLFAFIDDYIYKAPSTTELVLSLDVWTTYLPHTYITGCMLERGHAPMWAVNVDDYLSDPVNHTEHLSTPDDSFAADSTIVRDSTFKPVFTSDPMLIIASTIPHDELTSLIASTVNAGSPATYYDTGSRNGEQVGIRDYVWSAEGRTYAGMDNPSDVAHASGNTLTPYLYAIKSTSDLEVIARALPQLITSAKACVVVPSSYVTLSQISRTIGTATIWACEVSSAMHALETFTITKGKFRYPARYADIAKLYTFPYAHLTVSDDMGNSITIRIEDTHGTLDIKDQLSLALGALSWDAIITNVASTASNVTYTIRTLDGQEAKSLPSSDFAALTLALGIPTYALYLSTSTVTGMEGYANAQAQRRSAITNYQNAMRDANNTEANVTASSNTALSNSTASANTAYSNTTAAADTTLANATASANTAYSNATAAADTTLANTTASANTAYSNATAAADTTLSNATASANTAYSNAEDSADATLLNTQNTNTTINANATLDNNLRTAIAGYQNTATAGLEANANQNAYDSGNADGEYTMYATDAALKSESVSGVSNMMAHAASGDAMGVVAAGVASIVNITTKQALADLSELNTYTKISIAQDHNTQASSIRQTLNTNVTTDTNTNNTNTTTNTTTTSNTNAQNTRDVAVANAAATQTTDIATATATNTTTKANALASKNTAVSTATATNTTTKTNALASKNTTVSTATATNTTTKANALASKNTAVSTATATNLTAVSNAGYSHDTSEENLKQTLETARLNWQDSITAQAAKPPVAYGTQSGNALADAYGRKGVHVRILTQNAGAIARAGDTFLRYGYRYDGLWNVDNLVPSTKSYSYWQTSDLFLRSATLPNDVEHRLRAIFADGVTIWNDPTKIGDFA